MNVVILVSVVSILLAVYFIRAFLTYKTKVDELKKIGIDTQGLLLEVRNIGLQQQNNSKLSEIAVKFASNTGKDYIVRHRKELEEGEVVAVGSNVDLTYLESDPSVCNIPSLGLIAQNKWTSLITGIVVLVAGLFVAYIIFINIGTV